MWLPGVAASFLAFAFAFAAAMKVLAWRRGRVPSWFFGIRLSHRRELVLLAGVVMTEAITAVVLLVSPVLGLIGCSLLLAILTLYAVKLPEGTPCHCFGDAFELNGSRRGRWLRNGLLLLISVTSAGGALLARKDRISAPELVSGAIIILFGYALDRFVATWQQWRTLESTLRAPEASR